jgi:hypothetical protein
MDKWNKSTSFFIMNSNLLDPIGVGFNVSAGNTWASNNFSNLKVNDWNWASNNDGQALSSNVGVWSSNNFSNLKVNDWNWASNNAGQAFSTNVGVWASNNTSNLRVNDWNWASNNAGQAFSTNVGVWASNNTSNLKVNDWNWASNNAGGGQWSGVVGGVATTSNVSIHGKLVIGTSGTFDSAFPLHITSSIASNGMSYGSLNTNAPLNYAYPNATNISVFATGRIVASEFNAFSDERIKKNIQALDDSNAIEILKGLQPKMFQYVDSLYYGTDTVYGFISQQVASVAPILTNTLTEYIPNIYKRANVIGNEIHLIDGSTSNMIIGSVKVFDANDNEFIVNPVQILSSNAFTIDKTLTTNSVFVYGQEISNFMTIHPDQILALAVSSIQNLERTMSQQETLLQAQQATMQQQQMMLQQLHTRVSNIEFHLD